MGKLKVPIELSEARLAACRVWPEASHVIMSMVPVESPGLAQRASGSICVDQYWRLYYDPQAFLELSAVQRIATILHETAHLLGRHHVRAKRYVAPDDRQAWFDWNCACDMAVWSHVAASGMPVPETAVTAAKAGFSENLSVEQYMRLIRDEREQQRQQAEEQQQQQSDDDDQDQDTNGDSDGTSDDEHADDADGADEPEGADEDGDQSDAESESGGEGDQDGGAGEGQPDDGSDSESGSQDDSDESGCDSDGGSDGGNAGVAQPGEGIDGGSCADGVARDWELPAPDGASGGPADKQDTPPVVEQWKQEILLRGAADRMAASGRGTGAGMFREMIEHYQEPKLDPRRLLQKTLSKQLGNLQAGCGRFTYRRPARRPSLGGTLRPRSFQPVPRILVIIDTSGSMSSAEMRTGVGLVSKCINALRLQDGVRVIAGDCVAQWDEQVFNPRHIDLIGGGGTDMACLIELAASKPLRERPELIVVVTDGETGWPETRVSMPVVAAITRESAYAGLYPPPAWIESVKLY